MSLGRIGAAGACLATSGGAFAQQAPQLAADMSTASTVTTLAVLGALAAMAAYHLLLNFANNDRGFLKFSLFALGLVAGQVGLSGIGGGLWWEADNLWAQSLQPAGFAFAGLFAALYSRDFLRTGNRTPGLDRLIQLMAWIFTTIAVGSMLMPTSGTQLVAFAAPAFAVLAIFCGLRCRRLRAPGAPYYLFGWTALLAAALATGGASLLHGGRPSPVSLAAIQLLMVGGVLLLSLALSERTSAKWRERSEKQADTLSNFEQQLEALRQSDEHLTSTLAQRNREIDTLTARLEDGEQRVLEMSHLDPLTGLVNHLLLADRIEQGIIRSKRHNTRIAVIMVDLDEFRTIHDTHGPELASELLKAVAARLRALVREQDTVARLEEDEFVIVLEEIFDTEDLQRVVNAVTEAFVEVFRIEDNTLHVRATLGSAIYPDGGKNAGALLGQATKLMRRAKRGKQQHGSDKGIAAA